MDSKLATNGSTPGDRPIALSVRSIDRVVTVDGEIDVTSTDFVRQAILDVAATEDLIVVDLTGVTYADSSTIALMMTMTRDLRAKRCTLRIVAPSGGRPRRVFALTGVEPALSLFETLEDALAR